MGIQGLLPLLKSIQEHRKISEFTGQTLAVDAYVWLHRGAYGCAPDLIKGIPTTRYVDYAMHRVRLLKHHNITPYIVFDGGPLPAKEGTESSRLKSREENRVKGLELARQGRHSEARDCFVKAVDVTPEMAFQLIKALRAEGVSYVVAPYEADAQMAFLERTGIVDGIITEDSDLLVFGCKRVIFKLDSDGNCVCIRRENFARVTDLPLHSWTDKQFREMAILSGCDYLPSIQGLGLKTAHKLLRRHKTVEGVLNAVRLKDSKKIPTGYLPHFRTAELAFQYQRVFSPKDQCLVHLTPVPEGIANWDDSYVGRELSKEVASGLADGSVHPFTLLSMPDINPNFRPEQRHVVSFTRPKGSQIRHEAVDVKQNKNLLTNYFTAARGAATETVNSPRKIVSDVALPSPELHTNEEAKENRDRNVIAVGGGKRTLTLELDSARQILREREQAKNAPPPSIRSKFFTTTSRAMPTGAEATPLLPSPVVISLLDEEDEDESEELVTQEEGYMSPQKGGAELIDVSSPPSSREGSPVLSDDGEDGSLAGDTSDADVNAFMEDEEDIPSPQHTRTIRKDSRARSPRSVSPCQTPSKPSRAGSRPLEFVVSSDEEPDLSAIRLSQGSSSSAASQHPQPNTQPPISPLHPGEVDEPPVFATMDSVASLPTPHPTFNLDRFAFGKAPTRTSHIPSPSRPLTPPRSQPAAEPPSWGPDLQDIFSPVRSASIAESDDVPSPARAGPSSQNRRSSQKQRQATPEHEADDDQDVFQTPQRPRIRRRASSGSGFNGSDDNVDEETMEDDLFVPPRPRSIADRQTSIELQWQQKWALPVPSVSKRKTNVLSPRSEPHTKRHSQWESRADGALSPTPPERSKDAPITVPDMDSDDLEEPAAPRPRPRPGGPRRSLPNPNAMSIAATSTNVAVPPRKPLPRRNAMTFPAPVRPDSASKPKRTTSNSTKGREKKSTLDLDSFRHQPLRLR